MTTVLNQIEEITFPTRKSQDWKYTPLGDILNTSYETALPNGSESKLMKKCVIGGETSILAIVNGRFAENISTIEKIGMHVNEVEEKIQSDTKDEEAFVELNLRENTHTVEVTIPDNVQIIGSIHIMFLNTSSVLCSAVHPRLRINMGEKSHAKFTVSYASEGRIFTNAFVSFHIGKNAVFSLSQIQYGTDQSALLTTVRACLKENAEGEFFTFTFGGLWTRNSLVIDLSGERAKTKLFGLYLTKEKGYTENQTNTLHHAGGCISEEKYKGILQENSTATFGGKVYVAKNAQKTEAVMTNKNLLMGKNAKINTCPAFEIYADDVKCTHGAVSGGTDDDAMFYLASRGLDKVTAKALLTSAFAHEIIEEIGEENMKAHIAKHTNEILETEYEI